MIKARALIIFISRSVEASSPLRNLEHQGHRLIDQSGLVITPMPLSSFIDTEWLFFYSQNGIKCFFDQLDEDQKSKISKKRIGVMGKASAALIKRLIDKNADFIASSDAQDDATNFEFVTREQSILFVAAANSKRRFQNPGNKLHHELIIYQNEILPETQLPKADIYIFTSPLNSEAYLSSNSLPEGADLLAIGPSTAKMLEQFSPKHKIWLCHSPDEISLYDLILKVIALKW